MIGNRIVPLVIALSLGLLLLPVAASAKSVRGVQALAEGYSINQSQKEIVRVSRAGNSPSAVGAPRPPLV